MMPWVERYVGIPYLFGGSTREGADCWGLVRMVLREEFGVELEAFEHDEVSPSRLAVVVASALPLVHATRVDTPEPGDLALMRLFGNPCHIGVVVGNPGERNLLHTLGRHDSALDYYNGSHWGKRLEGFYRVA